MFYIIIIIFYQILFETEIWIDEIVKTQTYYFDIVRTYILFFRNVGHSE